ncbi:hypothetical protein C1X29_06755 [Pseudomonas sp. GW456-12-10-14-LB2]|nr:hypothetical protein C1X29_06755 [Pseudomonas sp. GW456-12-10-14-LB2]
MTKMSLDNVDYAKGITQAPCERLFMGKTRSRAHEGKLRMLSGLLLDKRPDGRSTTLLKA